jgi:hypothetical protein
VRRAAPRGSIGDVLYKLLGMAVWKGGKWFVRRRYGRFVPSRRVAAAGFIGLAVAGLALGRSRQGGQLTS